MALAGLASLLKRLSNSLSLGASSSSSTELQKLASTMDKIHAQLEDAEERDVSENSEQLRLRELKELAYDAEDAVDEYGYEVLHAKLEARRRAMTGQMGKKHDKVTIDLNYYHPKVSISYELVRRVKEIRERFQEITDYWSRNTALLDKVGKRRCTIKSKPIETTSFVDQTKTFGREDEKNQIITWLLQEEEEAFNGDNTVSILPIVGMGGLGKTTLAQMAYNDTRVDQYFKLRGWVHVSEEFDVEGLVKKICNSFCLNISHIDELNPMILDDLHSKLKVILDGKRFFLVLDDVWNQKIELWISLKTFLVHFGEGKILVTTRNEHVAEIMQTTPAMNLGHLSFDDSWLLFKTIAYKGNDQNYSEIGKEIVNKCQGLPLAIKVVAGILRVEDNQEVWDNILKSELWELDEGDDIFPVLKLSYNYLPIELKQCFMYLCLFPKGSELDRSNIIQQWMSHGFIQPEGKKMEDDVGNDYCNEFLQRSILQYCITNSTAGEVRMHDLIHDLAQYVAEDEYLLLLTNLKSHYMLPKTIRHISIHIENEFEIINLEPLREAKHLRTLILNVHGGGITNMTDVLAELTCLRTLVLTKWEPAELPDSIGRLKHLRYLQISFPEDQELEAYYPAIPASVCNLHYLQTLEAQIKLSGEIGDLINLRHLRGYDQQDPLPREVAGLTNLQTLLYITLGVGDEWFKMRDLKGLPNLRGHLRLMGLETVTWPEVDTPPEAYLKDARRIENLTLCWPKEVRFLCYDAGEEELAGDVDERLAARVLDSLQPHCGLEYMWIYGYPGAVLPTWLAHELPVLRDLWIGGMPRVKSLVLPATEEMEKKSEQSHGLCRHTEDGAESRRWFPSLESLRLEKMNGIEELPKAEDFLPCLRRLAIDSCPKLRTIPSFSHLDFLWIRRCPELRMLPSFSHLHKLIITGCPELRALPSISRLRHLTIMDCPELGTLPSLSNLHELWIRDCPELRKLPSLPSLTKLILENEFMPELLSRRLPMLHSLRIEGYKGEALIFPNDGSLDPLEELIVFFCPQLRSVEGLGGLPSLRHLGIKDCPLLRMSPDQRPPPSLQDVKISDSPGAQEWYHNTNKSDL